MPSPVWHKQSAGGNCSLPQCLGLISGGAAFLEAAAAPLHFLCVSGRLSFFQIAAEGIGPAGRAGMCLALLLLGLAQIVLHWHF